MSSNGRDATIDIAKGIAIISIVAGHVWRGLASAKFIDVDTSLFVGIDRSFYMFHLTVFAFTAGLYVQRGMRSRGAWKYAIDRDLGFLWLYVLWSLISGAAKIVMTSAVNNPTSIGDVLELWIPKEQYWFFGWIALVTTLIALVQPWSSQTRGFISLLLACGVSATMWGVGGSFLGTQGIAFTAFFWAAVLIQGDNLTTTLQRTPVWLRFCIGAAGATTMLWLVFLTSASTPTEAAAGRSAQSIALGIIASTSALLAVLAFSSLLSQNTVASKLLTRVGRESLSIFVAHVLFMAATRIILARVGIDGVGVQMAVGVGAGVVGPLLLADLARRFRIRWLFEKPRWLSGRQRVGSPEPKTLS